jgi:hypothetical protein
MTATAVATAVPARVDDRASNEPSRLLALAGAYLLSGVLLAVAEWMAARGGGQAHFYVFWIGYFVAVAPTAYALVSPRTSTRARATLVVALGIWSLAPVLLRTGAHPLYFDEFTHLRMLQDLVRTGRPVSSTGLLQIGASFPGLELATSAIYHLSGLTLWFAALTVAAVAHVALLAGVYVLVRDASRSARAGAIAAVVYALNPSWLFFDAQFSYETLAMPMLVWGLVFAMRGIRSRGTDAASRARVVQVALAALLGAALVVTHHVTAVVSVCALVGVALVATVQRRGLLRAEPESSAVVAWCLAGWGAALTVWRFVVVGHPLVVYLGPTFHVSEQLRQLLGLLGIGAGLPAHSAFANSSAPVIEVVCAYAMLPILLVAFVGGCWGLLGLRRELSPIAYVAAALGALFFVSLPLASAASYAEAVHRSWAFSFLGLAVVLGLAGAAAAEGRLSIRARARALWPLPERWHRAVAPLAAACAIVVAVGGVGVGTSTQYRFAGRAAAQSDPLYVGTQTTMLARWFAAHATARDVVWGNRFVVRPIAVGSRVRIALPGGSELHLVLAHTFGVGALKAFAHDGVTYIVYDRHTGHVGGVKAWAWYLSVESSLPTDERGAGHVDRLGCLSWANAVFATTDYEVLRVDHARLESDIAADRLGLLPGCQGSP